MAATVKEPGVILKADATNVVEFPSITGRLNGTLASFSAAVINTFAGRWFLIDKLKRQSGIQNLMSYKIDDEELFYPVKKVCPDDYISKLIEVEDIDKFLSVTPSTDGFRTISDYANAYRNGTTTPVDVVNKILSFLESDDGKKLNAIVEYHVDEIRQAAEESARRFSESEPRSILEGVPFVVKESVKMKGYLSLSGINIPGKKPSEETFRTVQRLLDAGAIMVGASNMTQGGYGTMGFNPSKLHGPVRNPYNTDYYVGGSSNGTAGAVAAGLVPFGIAVDGLGSGRIPAATAGIIGFKPTFSRVVNDGSGNESSYAVEGPMATCIRDIAIIYGLMAGPKEGYSYGLHQPQTELPSLNDEFELSSVCFGTDPSFNRLAINDEVIKGLESFVKSLETKGCKITDYCIPEMWENISAMITVISKGNQAKFSQTIGDQTMVQLLNCVNARVIYAMGQSITEEEVQQARRQRTRAMKIVEEMFETFDILITPTIAGVAVQILDGDERVGVLDDLTANRFCRYCALGSLTGIPSISLNIGYTEENLPIAIQLSAAWWNEKLLLEVAHKVSQMFTGTTATPMLKHIPF